MQSSFKQKMIKSLLDVYLLPVKINNKVKRFAQEVTLIDTVAHLRKPVQYLQSKNLLSKTPVIVDIGGAEGDTTAFFLNLLPSCVVYNFEANPQMAEVIRKRFANSNVRSHAIALSDKENILTFHITDNLLSSSYKFINGNPQFQTVQTIQVQALPLDSILANETAVNEIDILKLDVQGAELDVLNGARNTLKKTKIIVVEQAVQSPYSGGSIYFEVDQFLRGAGFDLLDIVITYRKDGLILSEFDSIYIQKKYNTQSV